MHPRPHGSTDPTRSGSAHHDDAPRHDVRLSVVVDVLAPVAVFYLARAAGVDQVPSLLLGAVPPAVRGLWVVARRRTVDALAGLVLSVIALTVATTLLTGDARLVLARDAGVTAAVGIWILVTLRLRRPFIFGFVVAFLGRDEHAAWEQTWARSSRFRHGMAVHTTIWGVGMLLDAVVRVVMALTLPVDLVPLLNGVQYAVLVVGLFVVSALYSRAVGLVPGSPHYPPKAPLPEDGSDQRVDGRATS